MRSDSNSSEEKPERLPPAAGRGRAYGDEQRSHSPVIHRQARDSVQFSRAVPCCCVIAGRLMSASSSKTVLPCCTKLAARFMESVVLPSPGIALVIRITLGEYRSLPGSGPSAGCEPSRYILTSD